MDNLNRRKIDQSQWIKAWVASFRKSQKLFLGLIVCFLLSTFLSNYLMNLRIPGSLLGLFIGLSLLYIFAYISNVFLKYKMKQIDMGCPECGSVPVHVNQIQSFLKTSNCFSCGYQYLVAINNLNRVDIEALKQHRTALIFASITGPVLIFVSGFVFSDWLGNLKYVYFFIGIVLFVWLQKSWMRRKAKLLKLCCPSCNHSPDVPVEHTIMAITGRCVGCSSPLDAHE